MKIPIHLPLSQWKKNPWKQILAVLILFLAFVFFKSERHEMSMIMPTLSKANPLWIIVGILVALIYILLQALMYVSSFKAVNLDLKLIEAIHLFLKRNFLSVFLPAGGISSLAYTTPQLRRKKFDKLYIHQASAIYGFVGLLTVFLIGIPVIIYSSIIGFSSSNIWIATISLGFILFIFYYIVISFREKNKFYEFLCKRSPSFVDNINEIFQKNIDKKQVYLTIIYSTLIEFCGISHVYIAIYALGLPPSFETAALGYTLSVLLMIVSPFLRGLGAVEFTMIYVFTQLGYSHSQGLAATLLYRIFEFWLPLLMGLISFFWVGRHLFARLLPAFAIFILGVVNIISVVTPPLAERLHLDKYYISSEIIHISKIMVLILGVALLVTSAYLIKGMKTAWNFAVAASVLSLLGNIVKALDYEEASLAFITLLLLIYSRKQYQLKANPKSLAQGFSLFFAGFFAIFIFNFLSFYLIDKIHFGIDFTWQQSLYYTFQTYLFFSDQDLIPRTHFAKDFKDINFFFGFISWTLLILAFFRTKFSQSNEEQNFEKANKIIKQKGNSSLDYFKTLEDKTLYFSENLNAFIAYRVANNFAIVLEEPVCADEEKIEAIQEFENFCKSIGLKSAYYRVGEKSLPIFKNFKKQKLLIGQEGIIDAEKFNLQGKNRKSLRNGINALEKKGYYSEWIKAPLSEETINQLQSVSDEWLNEFDKKEILFAEGKFDKDILKNQDVIVLRDPDEKIVTFLNIIPDFAPDETTYDMFRRTADSPNGAMDAVILKLIETTKEMKKKYVNIGLTPLGGITEPNNIVENAMKFAYQRFGTFKQYKTLRDFKEKYADFWENKYLIYSNDVELIQLPMALNNVMKA